MVKVDPAKILREYDGPKIRIMEVCGTHTHEIFRLGIRSLLSDHIQLISGPGCPVCVVPSREIDEALELIDKGVTITTFGDMLRVPGSERSLADAKAEGGDVRVVYGINRAIEIAEKVDNDVAFISAGFETTAPTTAAELLATPPENFSVLSCHRLIPPAIDFLINSGETSLNALIQPGHVCTIIGTKPFEYFSTEYGIPQAVAGFNPLDILMSVYMILRQIHNETPKIENEYKRAVREEGNTVATDMIEQVFQVESREWRGFPKIPNSILEVKKEFSDFNAREKYDIEVKDVNEAPKGCICGPILRGLARPEDCKLFRKACNPLHPIGACMVSKEGTCNIAHRYSRG